MQPNRSLMFHGGVVLVLALLVGVLIVTPGVANPRIAMSAHLAALIAGPILITLGLAWPYVALSPQAATRTATILVASFYVTLAFNVLAALLGTSMVTPIAGAGYSAPAWQEYLVAAGLGLAVVGLFVSFVAIAVGLARGRKTP